MESIWKNFDENFKNMSILLDDYEKADSNLNKVYKLITGKGNEYSMWNNFFKSDQDEVRHIKNTNLKTLNKKRELVDTFFHNTVVFAHGLLDVSTFITVPKNTIIITFVEETRTLKDTLGLSNYSQADILIYLWIKYLSKILDYAQKYTNPIDTESLKILIRIFMIKFIDIKNKYLNNPNLGHTRSGRHQYEKFSDDFLVYYENDLIPNQQLIFNNLYINGIMPWYKYLELSINERLTPNTTILQDYDEQDHPFYNILKSLNKNGPSAANERSNSPEYEYETRYESSEMRNDPSAAHERSNYSPEYEYETRYEPSEMRNDSRKYDLVQVLSEMKKRLDEKESGKINIIILKSCRDMYDLSLKPEHLFLFKNLLPVLKKKKKSNKELMSQIINKKIILEGKTKKEQNNILNRAAKKAEKIFTTNQEQLKLNYIRSIKNKLDCRGIGLAQEYDIFYEKICVNLKIENLPYDNPNNIKLYYYDDAKVSDCLFKGFLTNCASEEKEHNKTGLLIKIDTQNENENYNLDSYELNFFNKWIPVRNQFGHLDSMLISLGNELETKTNENNVKLSASSSSMNWMKVFSSSSFNFSPILLIRELEEKLFYIDNNQNTELFKEVYTKFYRLNFKPFEKFDLLKDAIFREQIFKEWEDNLKINTPQNTVRDIYIAIMRDRFVGMSREGGNNISWKNIKYKYGIKYFKNCPVGEKRKRNLPAPQLSIDERSRLKIILKIFSPVSNFKLFYCSTDFIKDVLFNLDFNLENTESAFHYLYAIKTRWGDKDGIFLTPIEYCLINYAVFDGKIWPVSQIISMSLSDLSCDVPDIKNPVIRHKLGFYDIISLYEITNNLKKFCDKVNLKANLPVEKIVKQNLKDYMELYYHIFVRDNLINGIQKYQNRPLNITNIKLFPGNFVFMLNYIQQNL